MPPSSWNEQRVTRSQVAHHSPCSLKVWPFLVVWIARVDLGSVVQHSRVVGIQIDGVVGAVQNYLLVTNDLHENISKILINNNYVQIADIYLFIYLLNVT